MAATATSIDREILEHEKKFWEASKNPAGRELENLTADRFTFVMAEGITHFNRREFIDMMRKEDFRLKSYKIDESSAKVRELCTDTALLTYKIHWDYEMGGKASTSDAHYTSIWQNHGGQWQCTYAGETLAKR